MKVLVIGSGGREHTFCWKLAKSQLTNQLFIAPGNGGNKDLAINLDIGLNDFESIKKAVLLNQIKLVVVGPEDPLVNGLHDFFLSDPALMDIPVIGPKKMGARPKFTKHTNRREALQDANYVQTTIQVGGYRPTTVNDFEKK